MPPSGQVSAMPAWFGFQHYSPRVITMSPCNIYTVLQTGIRHITIYSRIHSSCAKHWLSQYGLPKTGGLSQRQVVFLKDMLYLASSGNGGTWRLLGSFQEKSQQSSFFIECCQQGNHVYVLILYFGITSDCLLEKQGYSSGMNRTARKAHVSNVTYSGVLANPCF